MTGTSTIPVAADNAITVDSGCRYPGQNFLPWRRNLRKPELILLSALQTFTDREGYCWPSRKKLSEMTGYHVTKVSKITSRLVKLGVLEKSGRGGRSSCRYRVLVSKYHAPEKLSPPASVFEVGSSPVGGAPQHLKKIESGGRVTPAVTDGGHPEDTIELKTQLQHLEQRLCQAELECQRLRQRQEQTPPLQTPVREEKRCSISDTNCDPGRDTAAKRRMPPKVSRAEIQPRIPAARKSTMASDAEPPPPSQESTTATEQLVYPPEIEPAFAAVLLAIIAEPVLQQQVLDELAGQLRCGQIRNPYGYLKVLAEKAVNGQFIPNAGIRIAAVRSRKQEALANRQRAESSIDQRLQHYQQHSPPLPPGELGERLQQLRKRLQEKPS